MQVSLMNEFLKSYFTFTNIQTREFADFGQISIMERWRYQWISLSRENIIHNGNTVVRLRLWDVFLAEKYFNGVMV